MPFKAFQESLRMLGMFLEEGNESLRRFHVSKRGFKEFTDVCDVTTSTMSHDQKVSVYSF